MAKYYPPVGFHFKVEFEGFGTGTDADVRFQEVSGLNVSIETEAYQEGGENRFMHRHPKPVSYQNLVLKRGMLIGWFTDAIEGFRFKPTTVHVILLDETHAPLEKWTFVNAFPVKWNIDAFNAQDAKIVAETIELSYQFFKREKVHSDLLPLRS